MREQYMRQVELLMRTLPYIARQKVFALKGDTAINLFYRDMPRLSVDIDLVYLPVEDRDTTLSGIDRALESIREDLHRGLRSSSLPCRGPRWSRYFPMVYSTATKTRDDATIKIFRDQRGVPQR